MLASEAGCAEGARPHGQLGLRPSVMNLVWPSCQSNLEGWVPELSTQQGWDGSELAGPPAHHWHTTHVSKNSAFSPACVVRWLSVDP